MLKTDLEVPLEKEGSESVLPFFTWAAPTAWKIERKGLKGHQVALSLFSFLGDEWKGAGRESEMKASSLKAASQNHGFYIT